MGLLNGGTYASARAINAASQTIGLALDGGTLSYGQALWRGTRGTRVKAWSDCCGSGLGVPKAINLGREAVGYNEGGFDTYPSWWKADGQAVELPPLAGGNGRGSANDINDAGLVAGTTRGNDGSTRHCVLWQQGVLMADLGFLGEAGPGYTNQCLANGINQAGHVVGAGLIGTEMHAFVWREGNFTDLGLGSALDISDSGLIVGLAPGAIPVLWRSGLREYLPALGGGKVAYGHVVSAMNNGGDVVGHAPSPKAPFQDTAIVWRGGKVLDLGRFPGGSVSRAFGINDLGQIVGEGNVQPDGPMHALRWTIKPGQPALVELN